jgi:hypothetical protein
MVVSVFTPAAIIDFADQILATFQCLPEFVCSGLITRKTERHTNDGNIFLNSAQNNVT